VRQLPSGTVTLLFTDIEGSTRLLDEFGDGYADVLAEHRRVLREAFARHDGVEVDTQGDAFFVAFNVLADPQRLGIIDFWESRADFDALLGAVGHQAAGHRMPGVLSRVTRSGANRHRWHS
jgi:class 3 adenylate cyclase